MRPTYRAQKSSSMAILRGRQQARRSIGADATSPRPAPRSGRRATFRIAHYYRASTRPILHLQRSTPHRRIECCFNIDGPCGSDYGRSCRGYTSARNRIGKRLALEHTQWSGAESCTPQIMAAITNIAALQKIKIEETTLFQRDHAQIKDRARW